MSSGSNLGLAILLVLMIADGVHWISLKLQEAFADVSPTGTEALPESDTPPH